MADLEDILENIPRELPYTKGLRITCNKRSEFPETVSRLLETAESKNIFIDTIVLHLIEDHYEIIAWGEEVTDEDGKNILRLWAEGDK